MAELSELKMKRIGSTQGKILVKCTSQFFLAFRSSCKQSVRGDTDTFFAFHTSLVNVGESALSLYTPLCSDVVTWAVAIVCTGTKCTLQLR